MHSSPTQISDIRQDYTLAALDEQTTGADPILFFNKWFEEARIAQITEVNAMTLATVSAVGKPHARTVLLKGVEENGFAFFTNYNSAKGQQISDNPFVALLFFWKELERQVRVEGRIHKLSAEASDTYFNSRPAGSKLGAWASPQSEIIGGRNVLEHNYKVLEDRYKDEVIPRPDHWGGYLVIPDSIEFWQGRSSRMHDRILFTLEEGNQWSKCRLAP